MKNGLQIVVWNPGGNDVTGCVHQLVKLLLARKAEKRSIVVTESPCIGVPRLAFRFHAHDIDKDKSIDQLLLDYERQEPKSVHDYITKGEAADLIPVFPKTIPDMPALLKLNAEQTLMEVPVFLKKELCDAYDYSIFALQGQLIHPMSFISLLQADFIIIHVGDPIELVWAISAYKQLVEGYEKNPSHMLLYTEDPHLKFEGGIELHKKMTSVAAALKEREGIFPT